MYTIIRAEHNLYTVGFWQEGVWIGVEDFGNRIAALCFINYLNGGTGEMWVEPVVGGKKR